MDIDLYNFVESIVNSNVVAGTAAALTATIAASWQYHKQKIFNDIEETFIKNGITELKNYLHLQRCIVDHNYTICLDIFRYYRDLEYEQFLEQYKFLQQQFDQRIVFAIIPPCFYPVNELLGNSRKFIEFGSKVFINTYGLNSFFKNETFISMDNVLSNAENFKHNKAKIDNIVAEINKRFNSSDAKRHAYLVDFLEKIEVIFKKNKITSYKKLYEFKNEPEIKDLFQELLTNNGQSLAEDKG